MRVLHPGRIGICFCGGRKTGKPGEKPSEQGRELSIYSIHIWHRAGIEPGPELNPGRNWTRATLVGGERSHHCAIPAPHLSAFNHDYRSLIGYTSYSLVLWIVSSHGSVRLWTSRRPFVSVYELPAFLRVFDWNACGEDLRPSPFFFRLLSNARSDFGSVGGKKKKKTQK